MDRRAFLRRTGAVATAGVVAGCSGGDEPTETAATPTREPNTVRMVTYRQDYYFDPIGLFVEPGATVAWKLDSGEHATAAYAEGTATAEETHIPEGASGWNSETLTDQGATFEHTFETAGTYDYFCLPHKSLEMVGRVVVGEPGGPAEGSMPPDGAVPESQRIVDEGAVSYDAFSQS